MITRFPVDPHPADPGAGRGEGVPPDGTGAHRDPDSGDVGEGGGMTCLTHPILCSRRACPDFRECKQQKAYIVPKTLTKYYGVRNQRTESAIPGGQVREAESQKGCFRAPLGSVDTEDSRNSGRVKNRAFQCSNTERQGLV